MKLSIPQKTIANDTHRFKVVCAGRRFGKTYLSIRNICKAAAKPDQLIYYVGPTYGMAKNIVWTKLKYTLKDLKWVKKINESEMKITLKNSSVIYLKGADNPDTLRGVGLDYCILDEFQDMKPETWTEVLRPALSDKQGSALFIGTPKGFGSFFHELFMKELDDPATWKSFSYTTIEGGNVPKEEIEAARRDLDERTFRQEYEASFESFSGRIYYGFDHRLNLVNDFTPDYKLLHIGIDFNVDPMSAVVIEQKEDKLYVIDEIRIFSSNTQELCDEIKQRYPKSRIMAYPDPAGNQRKTSAGGQTDIMILRNNNFVVKVPSSHTPVRDRINAVNSRLKDSTSQIKLFVLSHCKHTIDGLLKHSYKEGTSQPDKNSGYDHMMDALGYCVDFIYPVKRDYDREQLQATRLSRI
jgi:phage terminase large subunit